MGWGLSRAVTSSAAASGPTPQAPQSRVGVLAELEHLRVEVAGLAGEGLVAARQGPQGGLGGGGDVVGPPTGACLDERGGALACWAVLEVLAGGDDQAGDLVGDLDD